MTSFAIARGPVDAAAKAIHLGDADAGKRLLDGFRSYVADRDQRRRASLELYDVGERYSQFLNAIALGYWGSPDAMKLLADSAEGAGYLLKDRISDVGEFVGAVQRVAEGGSAIDPIVVSTLLSRRRTDDLLTTLTPRERAVLHLAGEGRTNAEIGARLSISGRTAESHRANLMRKLGLRSHTELVRYTIARGILPPDASA